MFRRILIALGLVPTDEERKFLFHLKTNWDSSWRLSRRGGLPKSPKDLCHTQRYKDMVKLFSTLK